MANIPPLHGPKVMVYSDEGKAERFTDTMELTCRPMTRLPREIKTEVIFNYNY